MNTISGSVLAPHTCPEVDPHETDGWVPRFGRTERFAHWWTVSMVSDAILTGLAMGDDGGSGWVLIAHIGSVVLLAAGLALAALVGDHRALIRSARELFTVNRRDLLWLRAAIEHPIGSHPHPAWGMFNAGQKLLAWALSVSLAAVIVTGVQAWSAGGEGNGTHGAAVALTAALLAAHIFMAVLNPATRPALAGMVFGRVRRSWAAAHHPGWLDTVDTDREPRPRKP